MSDELKPCPFCGNEPAPYWKGVGCATSGCLLNGLHLDADKWNRRAQPAEAEGVVAWAPSTALDKLRNRHNNAPCVLTDGPAEFNDVPLVPLAALSAVTAERDQSISLTADYIAMLGEAGVQIEQLTAERDRLRDAAGKAIAWLDAEQNGSGVGINRRLKLCRDAENSLRAAMAAKEA